MIWKPKGMNKDLSVSAFNPEFVYENKNLRLSTNEHNTLLSWVNEKGTENIVIDGNNGNPILGIPVGTAILNHQLVLFTTVPAVYNGTTLVTPQTDYIYKLTNLIWASNSVGQTNTRVLRMYCTCLYSANLGFSTEWPLETLVSYEADHIQKVYWTDGLNQPRVINIADTTTLQKWQGQNQGKGLTTCFDFVPAINGGTIGVAKATASSGTFAPGVIQYCFTYYNKYGQQSNIVDVSPLYYLTHSERGASPEDKVTSSFEITLSGYDTNFDYIRLYSIQRTSLNDTPIVKLLDDIEMPANNSTTLKYIDNGTTGSMMDPTELLFIGGKEIKALTMTDKDNTLFLGNIEQTNSDIINIQEHFNNWIPVTGNTDNGHEIDITFETTSSKTVPIGSTKGIYCYENQLKTGSSKNVTTFKGGDTYRFGFQLQKANGEWTEPIFLKDKLNTVYPSTAVNQDPNLVSATATININNNGIKTKYKKIRPLIVHPTISDRNVLCQGVLNPTVFNAQDRKDNSPWAQASWFFRPFMQTGTGGNRTSVSINATVHSWNNKHGGVHYNYNQAVLAYNNTWSGSTNQQLIANGKVKDVFVVVLSNISDDEYKKIARRGTLRGSEIARSDVVGESSTERTLEYPYWGAINLTNNTGNNATNSYAFVGDAIYPEPYHTSGTTNEDGLEPIQTSFIYLDGAMYEGRTIQPFKISTSMRITSEKLLYYNTPSDDTNSFSFEFNCPPGNNSSTGFGYVIDFEPNHIVFSINSVNRGGHGLEFNHYFPLFCQSDITDTVTTTTTDGTSTTEADASKQAEQVEIQGSMRVYDSVFDLNPSIPNFYNLFDSENRLKYKQNVLDIGDDLDPETCTNMQFFVDQSILTLNSPDIEFDTEVQTWGTEGVHLRIVGAIPITANASYHKMRISTPSLPAGIDEKLSEVMQHMGNNLTPLKEVLGGGEQSKNVTYTNVSTNAGKRLISDFLWQDSVILKDKKDSEKIKTAKYLYKFLVFPWHRSGSLNNDYRPASEAASLLDTKKESQILFSTNSLYIPGLFNDGVFRGYTYENSVAQIALTENAEVMNYRLPVDVYGDDGYYYNNGVIASGVNYYPNIDKVLYTTNEYPVQMIRNREDIKETIYQDEVAIPWVTTPVSMKYKSTSHAVIHLGYIYKQDGGGRPYVAPYYSYGNNQFAGSFVENVVNGVKQYGKTFWNEKIYKDASDPNNNDESGYIRYGISSTVSGNGNGKSLDIGDFNFLWLGELYKTVTNPFGGDSDTAIRNNKWVIGGPTVSIGNSNTVNLVWTEGDTYYQRYDCLKTYPFTTEDPNQIVEILSFMCETHVNLDGRYDRNRGQQDNTNMHPKNFNLLNPVYSQRNNFFTYKCLLPDPEENQRYPNQIFYTKTKTSGADVDLWTNVTLASTLELDGDKGALNKLTRFNDQLIAFQDRGISQILYNENTQISTTAGVPIEIANSGKVQGKRYLSDTIGCSNKWSVVSTPSGIYFMDNNDKSIYLFNGQLANLSVQGGMNTWSKQNIQPVKGISTKWTPNNFGNFVSYYDTQNQDVMFINGSTSLHWSEKLGTFTSFYDYGHTPYFCTLDGNGIWVRNNDSNNAVLYGHQMGNYCDFFGSDKSYWMTLVGNPEPQLDKIFTNLEFRACVDGEGTSSNNNYTPYLPFNSLTTWNEYQKGVATLQWKNQSGPMKHHLLNGTAHLNRKFRLWRCDIPRDNDTTGGRTPHYNDRMRNPWLYLKLLKSSNTGNRTEIHDIMMTYFG